MSTDTSTSPPSSPEPIVPPTHLPPLTGREATRQNDAFARMRERAEVQLVGLNTLATAFTNAIDSDTGTAPSSNSVATPTVAPSVPPPPINPIDADLQKYGINDAGKLSSLTSNLRALAAEHQLNQNEQWFNTNGRQRYIDLRGYLSFHLGDLLSRPCWSGMGSSVDLSDEMRDVNTLVQTTILDSGDIPGDAGVVDPQSAFRRIDTLCDRLDQLTRSMRDEVRDAHGRIHNTPAPAPVTAVPPPASPTTSPVAVDNTDYVSGPTAVEYARIATQLQNDLPGVVAEEFWSNPLLRVNGNDIAARAQALQTHAVRLRPVRGQPSGTYDAHEVNDLYNEFQELLLGMRNQIAVRQDRPDAYRIDLEAEENRYLERISTGVTSSLRWLLGTRAGRYTAGASALAGMLTYGMWSMNSNDQTEQPVSNNGAATTTNTGLPNNGTNTQGNNQSVQTSQTTPQAPQATLGSQLNSSPQEFDLGHTSKVHREGDTLVLSLPSEPHFQFWVGLKGSQPVRMTPVAGNGRMEFTLPDNMKGQQVGVVLQIFNDTTKQWERGTVVYIAK